MGALQTFTSRHLQSDQIDALGRSIDDLEPVVTDRAAASERATGRRGQRNHPDHATGNLSPEFDLQTYVPCDGTNAVQNREVQK